jgi:hypothetical protein
MTIAFIPKLYLDDTPLFIVADSMSLDDGSATLVTQTQVHGSQVKITRTPDYTNSKSNLTFQMTMNSSDNEQENPITLFQKYKQKALTNVSSTIKMLPESGVGGLIFTNMVLINTLQLSGGLNASISFTFEGNPAVKLTT